ncbi:MAG: gamma carbonic anhydrase family protein [Sphaerochaetaceae bacterium]|nr:gamma carbonic anhydrase family protein [Sphaerochaetaceae bacterium]
MIQNYKEKSPAVDKSCFTDDSAIIIGDVHLSENCSVWPNATIRGDMAAIRIGKNSNIQDNCVVHVNSGMETVIEDNVTVGHGAILHACTIESHVLIGMGAIVLDQAVIGEYSLVAAGALVPPRKVFPPRSMIMGNPAKVVRQLTDKEVEDIEKNCSHYVSLAAEYREEQKKG